MLKHGIDTSTENECTSSSLGLTLRNKPPRKRQCLKGVEFNNLMLDEQFNRITFRQKR